MRRVVYFATKDPEFVPSPFYLEGGKPTDKYLWIPVEVLLERKTVICPSGEPGRWITISGGRHICIPEKYWKKTLTAGVVTSVISAVAVTAASSRVRAFIHGLHFAPEGSISPLLGQRGLRFIMKNPGVVRRSFRAAALSGFKVKRFGYYEWKGIRGLMVEGSLKDFPGSHLKYALTKDPNVLWAGYISIPKSSRKMSRKLFKGFFDLARVSGASKIRFIAGLENGSSMWARIGGKWIDESAARACKAAVLKRRKSIGFPSDLDKIIREAKTPKELVTKLDARLGELGTRQLLKDVEWWGELDLKDPEVASFLRKLARM